MACDVAITQKIQFAPWYWCSGTRKRPPREYCARCYTAHRHDFARFDGFRFEVFERRCRACRVCGQPQTEEIRLRIHRRRSCISRERLLITLYSGHNVKIHRLRVLDRLVTPLLAEFWRDHSSGAHEQSALDFGLAEAEMPVPAWLWESFHAR